MCKVFKSTSLAGLIVAGLTVMTLPAMSGAQEPSAYTPPAYQTLRYNEDWSVMAERDASESEDLLDPIKYVPLDDSGVTWVSFGGQVRERVEAWSGFNFGAPRGADDDDLFLLSRFLLHGDLHVGEHVRAFVQGKSAFSTHRDLPGGRRTIDADQLALQNGFIDVAVPLYDDDKVILRGGRQELLMGQQRLVSPLNWVNTRRTFDGFSAILEHPGGTVTGFWTRPVEVRKYDTNKPDNGVDFFGIYVTAEMPAANSELDVYWLGLKNDDAVFNRSAGREDRHTIGGRLGGNLPDRPLDYDVEGAYQFGEVGDDDISAFMIASQLGYTFTECPVVPRLHVGFDYASGDERAGDGDVETFNQLFPLAHAYLGYIDTVGRQNIIDLSAGMSVKPNDKLVLVLEQHSFWRADDNDALYNAGGGVVRDGSLGSSDEVGSEIDLTMKYKFDRHTLMQLGYSHFFAGDFIDESGPDEDIDFAYAMLQYTF